MLSADVEIVDSADVHEWRDDLAWRRVVGFSLADHSCREGSTSSAGSEVDCTFALHAMGSEKLGRGPFGGNTFHLTVLNGKVTRVEENWPYLENGFSEEIWEPFAARVVQEHPADTRAMYTDSSLTGPRLRPQVIAALGTAHRGLRRHPTVMAQRRRRDLTPPGGVGWRACKLAPTGRSVSRR